MTRTIAGMPVVTPSRTDPWLDPRAPGATLFTRAQIYELRCLGIDPAAVERLTVRRGEREHVCPGIARRASRWGEGEKVKVLTPGGDRKWVNPDGTVPARAGRGGQ